MSAQWHCRWTSVKSFIDVSMRPKHRLERRHIRAQLLEVNFAAVDLRNRLLDDMRCKVLAVAVRFGERAPYRARMKPR
jgi:hypothetical protein